MVISVKQFSYISIVSTLALSSTHVAMANPHGATVINGQVQFNHPDPNTLAITNSNGAIINWQQFSIQQNEITKFIQPDAASAVLNRVTGGDPSSILGQLLSNGRVFLINPNGIVFGPNSVIDTAGLIASTLDMTDEDFINQNLAFQGDNAADITNKGYIKAGENGDIFLIAPNIENSGIIETEGGQIVLAAGESVSIVSLDSDHIVFDVQAPENEVLNLGEMITKGGAARMFAGTIKHEGSINADSISVDENGNVQLFAKADIEIATDAVITANGASGGEVEIESEEGTVWNAGSIEAKGEEEAGGKVEVLGERVALLDDASIDASGETGGGEVYIGGDYKGENPEIKNAKQTYVGEDTSINADAITNGDGGKVIVWADETTQFYGEISARGGAESGDGGFIETSGKEFLEALGIADASAINGNSGEWLLDPRNVELRTLAPSPGVDNSTNGTFSGGTPDVFTPTGDTAVADIDQIVVSLESGTNVTITTGATGSQNGDITVVDAITLSLFSGDVLLTLDAANDIFINNTISAAGSSNFLTLGLDAPGTITINGDFDTNGGLIDATSMGAGNVVFTAGTHTIDSFFNATTITVDGGDTVNFNGPTTTSTLNHSGGTIGGIGTINVGSSWNPTGGANNISQLILAPGSSTTLSAAASVTTSITNFGFLNLNGNTLTTPTLFNDGLLHGNGTIAGTVFNSGTVTPGNIIGTMNITGAFTQNSGGVFQLDVAGTTTPGTDYDLLNVTGAVNLAGTLDIQFSSGITGAIGDQFDIINSSGVSGDFTTVTASGGQVFTTLANTPNAGDYQLELSSFSTTINPTNDILVLQNFSDDIEVFFIGDQVVVVTTDEDGKKKTLACS